MQGPHELGGSRDETVGKIHHAEEVLQGVDSEWAWELCDRLHLRWERGCSVLSDSVSQVIDDGETKLALGGVDN